MKEGFILYWRFYDAIKSLSFEDKGRLFDAIYRYQIDGIIPKGESLWIMAFNFFKTQFDLDNEKYNRVCERNRNNGKQGGRPIKDADNKKPTGLSGIPKNPDEPKKPDKDKEKEKEEGQRIKEELLIEFERFWDLYDKKRGDRRKVHCKWLTLSKKDKDSIFQYIPKYILSTPDKQFRKDPLTFLNNRGWEDEIIIRTTQNENLLVL